MQGQSVEMHSDENLEHSSLSSNDSVHQINHDDGGSSQEEHEISGEEVRGILETIASTGRFWHDWDKLKSMLSFQLKQVLLEYPEAKMTTEQQNDSLGETYNDLVKRLDEAHQSFIEGPPFTLQRLCEILLDAHNIYPNLSKLALALEKNLLVTSTLTMSTDSYPQSTMQKLEEPNNGREEPKLDSGTSQNGVEPVLGDRDEVMTEVEEAEAGDDMTIDMEAFEDIVKSSEKNSQPSSNS